MARRYTGLTVETQQVIVLAKGLVTSPLCVQDPTNCCTTDIAIGCCPNLAFESLDFIVLAPVGAGNDLITFQGTLTINGGKLSWSANDVIGSDGMGAGSTSVSLNLYCLSSDSDNPIWILELSITDLFGTVYKFEVELEVGPTTLFGSVIIDGKGEVTIGIENPCHPTFFAGDCAVGVCPCSPISSRWSFINTLVGSENGNVTLITGGSCIFRSADGKWTLRYDSDFGRWEFSNVDGRKWYRNSAEFTCCDPIEMISDDVDVPNMLLTPVFDCCPDEPTGTGTGSGTGTGTGTCYNPNYAPQSITRSGTIAFPNEVWYETIVSPSTQYHVSSTGLTDSSDIKVYQGSNCADKSLGETGFDFSCIGILTGSSQTRIWVRIAPLSGSRSYTVTVSPGTCF